MSNSSNEVASILAARSGRELAMRLALRIRRRRFGLVAVALAALLLPSAHAVQAGESIMRLPGDLNPCAAKTINPCAAKTINPCAA